MDCEAKSVLKSVSGSPSEDWPSTSVHSRLNEKAIKRRRYEKKNSAEGTEEGKKRREARPLREQNEEE